MWHLKRQPGNAAPVMLIFRLRL